MTPDEQDALRERYRPGVPVTFRDGDSERSGIVNGPIWFADDEQFGDAYVSLEGAPLFLPVWAETPVLVAWENVVGDEEHAS